MGIPDQISIKRNPATADLKLFTVYSIYPVACVLIGSVLLGALKPSASITDRGDLLPVITVNALLGHYLLINRNRTDCSLLI